MQFEAKALSETIALFVESIFHYSGFEPDHSIERVVPTGHHYILFELDGMTRHTFDPESLEPDGDFEKAWVSAVRQNHLSISAHQQSEMLVIQFKPYGAFPVFHESMEPFADRVVPGQELLNGELLELRDAIVAVDATDSKLQLAEDWVSSRLNPDLAPPGELVELIEQMFSEPSRKLAELTENYPTSQKHLIDQFKRYVGVTPKVLQRIVRFNEILRQIQESQSLVWSDIANLCGYSDQPHFIREFKQFSGFNPSEFIQRGFDEQEPNFFPMDSTSEE